MTDAAVSFDPGVQPQQGQAGIFGACYNNWVSDLSCLMGDDFLSDDIENIFLALWSLCDLSLCEKTPPRPV